MPDFLCDLSMAANNDILSDLNFANNTVDEFNSRIDGSNLKTDFTVFYVNIRSLNKNGNALYNFFTHTSFDIRCHCLD